MIPAPVPTWVPTTLDTLSDGGTLTWKVPTAPSATARPVRSVTWEPPSVTV